jgi:hypothetical protein
MRPKSRTSIRVLDVVFLSTLLLLLLAAAATAYSLQRHLASARSALDRLEPTLAGNSGDFVRLLQDPEQMSDLRLTLAALDADLGQVDRLAGPLLPLCPHLGWLPRIGGDLAAAPQLLTMARQATKAAESLFDASVPIAEYLRQAQAGVGHLGPALAQGLVEAQPQVEGARTALARATEARALLKVSQLSPRLQEMVERFDRYGPALDRGLTALAILPALLGADGPRSYLILAQNNQELRATGGFISGVGLVTLEAGAIVDLRFQDSYTVDDLSKPHPAPPDALRRTMGAGLLLLRDANWWPDFPTSAQAVTRLYQQDQGQRVDGVVAVDLNALQLLLQALGPIQVPGYDELVSSDDLESMIMSFWEAPRLTAPGKDSADWWLHRKDFAADLMSALLTHLSERATLDDLADLARVVGQALRERHLLISVQDSQAERVFHEMAWDGALRPADGDYLMVVDSNVGFNKANPNVEQTVDLQVELGTGQDALSRLTLSYRHRVQRPTPACVHESYYGDSYADLTQRCYWDYLRVYLPAGSELVEVLGADEPAQVYQESGHTVVATSFLLETGGARQIQIRYRPALPPGPGRYRLLVQKQPGTGPLPLRVSIAPAAGASPTLTSPAKMVWLDGRAVWQGDLAQDRAFELDWK